MFILLGCKKQLDKKITPIPKLEVCVFPISSTSPIVAIPYDLEIIPNVDLSSQWWTALILVKFTSTHIQNQYWNNGNGFTTKQVIRDTNTMKSIVSGATYAYKWWRIRFTMDSIEYANYQGPKDRMHVISKFIRNDGSNSDSVFYPYAGGIAYMHSLYWDGFDEGFVFCEALPAKRDKACALTHEVGHMIGLVHQSEYDNNCVKIDEYRPNCIMGMAQGPYIWNWVKGPSRDGCNVIQNDSAILDQKLGRKYYY